MRATPMSDAEPDAGRQHDEEQDDELGACVEDHGATLPPGRLAR
jgi:hypothetical protein